MKQPVNQSMANIDVRIRNNAAQTAALFNQIREAETKRYKRQEKNWKTIEILISLQFALLTVLMTFQNETVAMFMAAFYAGFVIVRTSSLVNKKKKKNGIVNK